MIVELPQLKSPKSSKFLLASMTEHTQNPFNPAVEIYEGEEYWEGELKYENLNPVQTREMRVWINNQRGGAGEFYFRDITHTQQGAWGGSIVVDGANQDGIALNVRGAIPNQLIAPAGDRFQLGEHLYELTQDITADGAGQAQLNFLPDIRIIPTDGQTIISTDPACKCMLYPNQKAPQGTTRKHLVSSFSFRFRERLR